MVPAAAPGVLTFAAPVSAMSHLLQVLWGFGKACSTHLQLLQRCHGAFIKNVLHVLLTLVYMYLLT